MKNISKIFIAALVLLINTFSFAKIKNEKTENVKIYGNCNMCKATIEKAGNLKNTAKVDWNKETKMAVLAYDAKKTNPDEILKRIALAGYDSDKFLAPTETYSKLQSCCQYDRERKSNIKVEVPKIEEKEAHAEHTQVVEIEEKVALKEDLKQLIAVFENYFALKDALVKTDGKTASVKAAELATSLSAIKMNELPMDVHSVLMKVIKELGADAKKIADSKKIEDQRKTLISLTANMYALMKVVKTETPIYYQFCPMANGGKGANWLSKENEVRNPYYGSMMMNCGSVVETIK